MQRSVLAASALVLFAACGAQAREFYTGYTGTVPPAKEDQAKTYFYRPEVQRLLGALENGPVSEVSAAQFFMGTETTITDLERMRLVRSDKGMMRLGFAYFTAADMDLIHATAEKYVPTLVAAFAAQQPALDAVLARYPVASVPKKRLAFVVLAGFSLNWDALGVLAAKKYRQPLLVQGPGWQYSFWASEAVPDYSYKGYYWGSNTFPAGAQNLDPPLDVSFSSFGDPDSDPRMNFPDLFALPQDAMTSTVKDAGEKLGLHDESVLGMDFKHVVGLSRARSLSALLMAMRISANTKDTICAALPPDAASDCDGELGLLVAAGYATQAGDGSYALAIPVFDSADKTMLDSALAMNRKVISNWLTENYGPMHRELFRLSAVRQGVPYPAVFGQIWHELFGLATRQLATQGVIEDPRGPNALWPGSEPAVWRTTLYQHAWQ
jgi:hypothetical protein